MENFKVNRKDFYELLKSVYNNSKNDNNFDIKVSEYTDYKDIDNKYCKCTMEEYDLYDTETSEKTFVSILIKDYYQVKGGQLKQENHSYLTFEEITKLMNNHLNEYPEDSEILDNLSRILEFYNKLEKQDVLEIDEKLNEIANRLIIRMQNMKNFKVNRKDFYELLKSVYNNLAMDNNFDIKVSEYTDYKRIDNNYCKCTMEEYDLYNTETSEKTFGSILIKDYYQVIGKEFENQEVKQENHSYLTFEEITRLINNHLNEYPEDSEILDNLSRILEFYNSLGKQDVLIIDEKLKEIASILIIQMQNKKAEIKTRVIK